jgi:uncharacterized protein YbjQ (UPF0145 family)
MSSFSDDYRRERMRRSREQVEKGGLPVDAEWRLNHLRENRKLFTSNLSVAELALCVASGIKPLGQVMGASTYKVGWRGRLPIVSQVMTTLTNAHNEARRLAVGRLQKEAALLGADGVIGVRLRKDVTGVLKNRLEYVAIGTAVRLAGPQRWKTPFVAPVSVQEVSELLRAGHFPIGLVAGGCVYYHAANFKNQWATGMAPGSPRRTKSAELTDYARAFNAALEKAMGMVRFEAEALGADGVIGIAIEKSFETREVEMEVAEAKVKRRDLIVHVTASGTAIMPCAAMPFSARYEMPMG